MLKLFLVFCSLSLATTFTGCSSKSTDSNGGGSSSGQPVVFELTPNPSPSSATAAQAVTLTVNMLFHCVDQTEANCHTRVYLGVAANPDDWMSYAVDYSGCVPFFAHLVVGTVEYDFTGTVQRPFGTGTGPFVTGNYTSIDGATFGFGTFTLDEQQLVEANSPICSS